MYGILVSVGRLVSNVWWCSQLTKGITIIFSELILILYFQKIRGLVDLMCHRKINFTYEVLDQSEVIHEAIPIVLKLQKALLELNCLDQ